MSTPWRSTASYTYEIGYQTDHVGNPAFIEKLAEARPGLVHTGHDGPLTTWMGNCILRSRGKYDFFEPDELDRRIAEVAAFVSDAHAAGVRSIIPYLCTMLAAGHKERRTGLWAFFDRWDEWAAKIPTLGAKPETEPDTWSQYFHGPYGPSPEYDVYEPSIAHPGWRRFLVACTELVARAGYDGTFLDVNAYNGYTVDDAALFADYLRAKYTETELADLVGIRPGDGISLGKPGDGFLWVETQRFRAHAFGELFATLRDAGRAYVPGFFILPNNSPYGTVEALYSRRKVGQGLAGIRRGADTFMYEEMLQPGRHGADRINDSILQLRYSLAHRMTGVTLLYNAKDADGIAIANAEIAANGGGAFTQPTYDRTAECRFWGVWFDAHQSRLAGLDSLHDVGVLFFAGEMYWDNRAHVEMVYRLRQALSNAHVLFDFLVEPEFTAEALASFAAVIVPAVGHLTVAETDRLVEYVAGGGSALLVGECGTHDERGKAHTTPLAARLAPYPKRVLAVDSLDSLVPPRAPELFDLTEDQINDFPTVAALPDRVASRAEAEAARRIPLVPTLEKLAGRGVRALGDDAPYSLRASAFRHPETGRIVAHLVNYDLPVRGIGECGPPIPTESVRIAIPGVCARSARWWRPEALAAAPLVVRDGIVEVPAVRLYAMIEIEAEG